MHKIPDKQGRFPVYTDKNARLKNKNCIKDDKAFGIINGIGIVALIGLIILLVAIMVPNSGFKKCGEAFQSDAAGEGYDRKAYVAADDHTAKTPGELYYLFYR